MTMGHNSKSVKAGPVSNGRVKSFIERVERLEEERKAIGGDVRDVYAEAKGVGYDVKTLRWMVQERKVDAADRAERDALRETYANALSMAVDLVRVEGLSLRQAEEITGASKSSIQRALAVPEVSQTASIMPGADAWQEITRSAEAQFSEPATQSANENGLFPTDSESGAATPRPMVADDLGDPLLITNPFRAKVKAIAAEIKVPAVRMGNPLPAPLDDDLAIPHFLDRRVPA